MRRASSGLLLPLVIGGTAFARGEPAAQRVAHLTSLVADPADAEALIGLADLHEAAGRHRHARRYPWGNQSPIGPLRRRPFTQWGPGAAPVRSHTRLPTLSVA